MVIMRATWAAISKVFFGYGLLFCIAGQVMLGTLTLSIRFWQAACIQRHLDKHTSQLEWPKTILVYPGSNRHYE